MSRRGLDKGKDYVFSTTFCRLGKYAWFSSSWSKYYSMGNVQRKHTNSQCEGEKWKKNYWNRVLPPSFIEIRSADKPTNQPTIGHGVETLTSTVINLFPCAHSRYSGTSEHDETRQRFVLGLLWLWRNQGGVGPRVHQLLAVQEQRHGQVVSTVCAEQWCLWAGARAFRDPPGGAGVQAAETASDSSVFPPRRSSHFISFICSRRKSPQCRIY